MQTIILCGGKGTRMKEETEFKPKPMVTIGGKPILWHIMKIYSHYGYNDFILTLGYKGSMIRDYFSDEKKFNEDGKSNFHITFVDTGEESKTGERILRAREHLDDGPFMVTYGDGVSDIDIRALADFHRRQGTRATITGVRQHSRFGLIKKIDSQSGRILDFQQKPLMSDYVAGGFMVFEKAALPYIDEGWVEDAFPRLVAERQLSAYIHDGFWKAMDTYAEMEELNKLWEAEKPWAVWEKRSNAA